MENIEEKVTPVPEVSTDGSSKEVADKAIPTPDVYKKVEDASPEDRDKFWSGEEIEIGKDVEGQAETKESDDFTAKEMAYLQSHGITDAKSFDEILNREKSRREELNVAQRTFAEIDKVAKKVGLDRESFITWLGSQEIVSAVGNISNEPAGDIPSNSLTKWLDELGERYKRQDERSKMQYDAGRLESYDPAYPDFEERRDFEIQRHKAQANDFKEMVAPLYQALGLLSDRLNVSTLPEHWENLPEKVRVYHEKNRHELTKLVKEYPAFFHLKNHDGTARNPYYPAIATYGKDNSAEVEAQRIELNEAEKLETKRRIMNKIEGMAGGVTPPKKTNVFSGGVPPANAPKEVHKAYQDAVSKEAARRTKETLGAGISHRRK